MKRRKRTEKNNRKEKKDMKDRQRASSLYSSILSVSFMDESALNRTKTKENE